MIFYLFAQLRNWNPQTLVLLRIQYTYVWTKYDFGVTVVPP